MGRCSGNVRGETLQPDQLRLLEDAGASEGEKLSETQGRRFELANEQGEGRERKDKLAGAGRRQERLGDLDRAGDLYRAGELRGMAATEHEVERGDNRPDRFDDSPFPGEDGRRNLAALGAALDPGLDPEDRAVAERLERTIDADFVDVQLEEGVEYLRRVTGANVVIDPGVLADPPPPLTMQVADIKAKSALGFMMRMTGLRFEVRDGAVVITDRPATERAAGPTDRRLPGPELAVDLRRKLAADFCDTELSDVVAYLNRATGARIVLDPAVADRNVGPVNLQVRDMSLENLLDHLVTQTGLDYTFDGGAVVITDDLEPVGHEPAWQALNRQGRWQRRYRGEHFPELVGHMLAFPAVDAPLPAALEPAVRVVPLELRPGRFLTENIAVSLPAGERTAGSQVLQLARRAGMQALPAGDHLLIRDPTGPLDPTATYGLEPEAFKRAFGTGPMIATAEDPHITFAFDDDTASFDRALMLARRGADLDGASLRTEHFVNAIPTGYPAARGPEAFDLYAEAAPSPFAADERTLVVAVGAVARAAGPDERKPLRLTLCLDASGSMARPGGLDRIRPGLRELIARLGPEDRVSLVAFDDRARLLATGLPADRRARLRELLAGIEGSGATNAAEGMALAYQVAAETAETGTASRVLLVTDGATMVGRDAEDVLERVRRYRGKGITLTIVGVGAEPFAADALERLADAGDGEHRFVADAAAAEELFTTRLIPDRLGVLARDAKVQVAWNSARVAHHRLLGYEERRLRHEQFRDDQVDAGELSHATRATALFEVRLHAGGSGPLGRAAVRYFDTRYEEVRELGCDLSGGIIRSAPGPRLRLQACAAATAEWLQGGWWSNVRLLGADRIAAALAPLARDDDPDVRSAVAKLQLLLSGNAGRFRE